MFLWDFCKLVTSICRFRHVFDAFLMILDSGENCVRSVLWHFRWFFSSCWATLARALSVPSRSSVLGARNCTAEGYEPVCALLKCAFFSIFPAFFVFSEARFEHGRFPCKGGREMAGKFPTTFAVSSNRPSALWASQPSLLSCSLPSTFVLHFPSCFPVFPQFFLFSPFSLLPFFLFFQFSSNFSSPPPIFSFFQRFLVKATRLHVTPLSAMCFVRHLPHIWRDTLWKCIFAYFSAFLGTFKKTGSYWMKRQKRKLFAFT